MQHTYYEKIGEDLKKWNLTESDYRRFRKTDWVVTEKIHGANFAILTDGHQVQFAKRKEILEDGEDFFGYFLLKKQLENQALEVYNKVKNLFPDTRQVTLYGELFGGNYPHPDVAENPKVQAIQTGVYYSPTIEYALFDVAYETVKERNYLDYNLMTKIAEATAVFYIPALFAGKYEQALAYPFSFESKVPALLGFPALTASNLAEGIVIKPAIPFFVETSKGLIRPVLKKKIPQFSEDEKFSQAQKWIYTPAKSSAKPVIDTAFIENELVALVNQNRLANVISKEGNPDKMGKRQQNRLRKLLVEDALESFQDKWGNVWETVEEKKQADILNLLYRKAETLWAKN